MRTENDALGLLSCPLRGLRRDIDIDFEGICREFEECESSSDVSISEISMAFVFPHVYSNKPAALQPSPSSTAVLDWPESNLADGPRSSALRRWSLECTIPRYWHGRTVVLGRTHWSASFRSCLFVNERCSSQILCADKGSVQLGADVGVVLGPLLGGRALEADLGVGSGIYYVHK
jgi:hypothetical protein